MSKREAIAKALDKMGITTVYADDPVDGSRIEVVHIDDLGSVLDLVARVQDLAVRNDETPFGFELAAILDELGAW